MSDKETPVINSEEDYQEVQRVLTKKRRPPKVLRIMMNALESYRQARKYGWSRPWNKYDLLNFQSFKLDWQRDAVLLEYARRLLDSDCGEMPEDSRAFCNDLMADRERLMGFIFIHDFSEDGARYEGATLSLGRINAKRHRDRLDIILESPVQGKNSLGLNRLRVYVDPFEPSRKAPLWFINKPVMESATAHTLFTVLSETSWAWAGDPEKMWDHWTSLYIDYFGDRTWEMDASYFYVAGQPQARIAPQTPNPGQAATG